MNGVFKHVIDKVGVRLHEISEDTEHLEVLFLLVIKGIERHIVCVDVHFGQGVVQLLPIHNDLVIPFFYFFLFLLKTFQLFIDLVFHHLEQILLLNLELLNDPGK